MPNTINGWTGASLGPSYSIVNSILNGAGGPTQPAQPAAPVTVPTGTGHDPAGGAGPRRPSPLPSTPPVNPPGFTNYTDMLSGLNGAPAVAGSRQGQQFTPEQAYSRYLQARAGAENSTPFTNAANLLGQGIFLPGIYGTESNQPGQGFGFGTSSANSNLGPYSHAATQILNQMLSGPQFSMAYGTPAAQAPAPTPAWGYPTGYGQQATSSGWATNPGSSASGWWNGFGGGGF